MGRLVRLFGLIGVAILIVQHGAWAAGSSLSSTEREVLRVAERYIATHYPDFDNSGKTPVVENKGEYWEVIYKLPADMIGGSPVLFIEKQTLKILRAYRTQ